MKVLYIASNPSDHSSLNIEREITELQFQASEGSPDPVQFTFLPGLNVEELPIRLNQLKPDILHIASHSDGEVLTLSSSSGGAVSVTASMLKAFFNHKHPPQLVYLNSCDSRQIAADLKDNVDFAIGTTAPITNRAARSAAVTFYERLLSGVSVEHSFRAGEKLIEALQGSGVGAELFSRKGVNPAATVLHHVPRIVATFDTKNPKVADDGYVEVRLGIIGCPPSTRQIIFFTDDESFVDDPHELEDDLCLVLRDQPVRGTIWTSKPQSWEVMGDFRLFAVGVTGDARTFSVSSTLSLIHI